ncbi:unnamed protein product [Peronospora belbahrii]|uniref:Potassium channel tetramerisation-type BTB domain-containing protein n=1 Tax=Peronospora belbahrii TaxID=622444 RepID=A0AAU9L357_9STRA|nr:unnamed protein product [Peronospora belbahrii]
MGKKINQVHIVTDHDDLFGTQNKADIAMKGSILVSNTLLPSDKCLPLLSRSTSQGASFHAKPQTHLDTEHPIGRTRVPWHSKSVSDLRNPDTKPVRIVAFDVGGKLFRCKESLIAKYPLKRLNQIIMCACGKVGCLDDAFYIDRNPQHFEMILDWYRTGKLVRQRNVNEQAFKDDAVYFDLYEELFPSSVVGDPSHAWSTTTKTPAEIPTRRRSVNDVDLGRSSTKRVSMFANLSSPSAGLHLHKKTTEAATQTENEKPQDVGLPTAPDDESLRYFRCERCILTPTSTPLVFTIRKFEQLQVESVAGRGKLMVRVCDTTGMQKVNVPEAVVFDSHSRFYLKGARTQLQHNALLPGDHVYTFWMEEDAIDASYQASAPSALKIVFKLFFTFESVDRLTSTMEVKLSRGTSEGNDAIRTIAPEDDRQHNRKSHSFSPSLFMPLSQVKRDLGFILPPDATSKRIIPLTLNKHLSSSPSMTKTQVVRRGNYPDLHVGATIMHGAQVLHP